MESSSSVKPKERKLPPPVPVKPVELLRKNIPPPVPPKPTSSRSFNSKSKDQLNSDVSSNSIVNYSLDTTCVEKGSNGGFLFSHYLTNPNRYEESDDYSSFDDDDFSDDERINTISDPNLYLHASNYTDNQFISVSGRAIEGVHGRESLNQPDCANFQSVEMLTEFGHLLEGNEQKAYFVAKEIVSSERIFVDCLRLICIEFRAAVAINILDADKKNISLPVISEAELSQIIVNFLPLKKLNEEILGDFEDRLKNWIILPKIADVLLQKGPFLKIFSAYIQDFEKQSNFLDECVKKYPRFRQALADFESTPICRNLTLKHYFLKPVQRLPQYRLLFESYLQCLTKSSIDYEDTVNTLRIVSEVAEHANKTMAEQDFIIY